MSDSPERCGIEKDFFFRSYRVTEEAFKKTGLEWSLLEHIHQRHTEMTKELQTAADYVSGRLQLVPTVHSLKVRIKNAEHLIEKIIRKQSSSPELRFDCMSYETLITDLIGIRALHLFKDEWQEIHKFVTATWDLHEEPLAYVREGDPAALLQGFRDAGCRVEKHPFGYRSVHYVLKTQPTRCTRLVELQVRTIFEEGWSEIDHRVRYPRQSDNPYLAGFLTIFNRLAGAADEMGTFTQELSAYIRAQAEQSTESENQMQRKEDELKKAVSQLHISEVEKANLENQIAELRRSSKPLTVSTVTLPSRPEFSWSVHVPAAIEGMQVLLKSETRTCSVCKKPFLVSGFDPPALGPLDQCPSCRSASFFSGLSGVLGPQ
jgi:putative GTP pyrophosphokinase